MSKRAPLYVVLALAALIGLIAFVGGINQTVSVANAAAVTTSASATRTNDNGAPILSVPTFTTAPTTATTPPAPAVDTAIGTERNTNPVSAPVQNWRQLVDHEKGNAAYKSCLLTRTGITWAQAKQYASLVDQGKDLRFIVISNSQISNSQARAELTAKGYDNVDKLGIRRVDNGFSNTAGIGSDRCSPFQDQQAQVRIVMGVPIDVKDLGLGMRSDKGVLGMCGNPIRFETPKPAPTTTVQPTPSAPKPVVTTSPTPTPVPPTPVTTTTTTVPTAPPTMTTTVPPTTSTTPPTTTTVPPTTTTVPPTTTTPPPTTTPPATCTKTAQPTAENGYTFTWDQAACGYVRSKVDQTFGCMQNGGATCAPNLVVQKPLDNTTSGVNTGSTSGAPTTPSSSPTTPPSGVTTPSNSPVSQTGLSDSSNNDGGAYTMPTGL